MVAGLKFLSKKGFNPQNLTNQKRVWEAQKVKEEEVKKAKERERQLQRERDDEELAKARGETPRLGFLYAVPPGLEQQNKQQQQQEEQDDDRKPAAAAAVTANGLAVERQPGDDDAAAAFRRMLAAGVADPEAEEQGPSTVTGTTNEGSFGTVLQGTSFDPMEAKKTGNNNSNQQSALEKAVGRRQDHAGALSLEDQIQRFPSLANAPRAKGMTATDIGVSFKPLGTQIRNVRCMACGIWGHSRGDRECEKSGWNPFASGSGGGTAAVASAAATSSINRQGHEQEEERKKKKHKKRHRHDDTSSSLDSSSNSLDSEDSYERRRRRKKKHKRKEHKRRHRSESDGEDHHRRHHKSHKKRHKRDH